MIKKTIALIMTVIMAGTLMFLPVFAGEPETDEWLSDWEYELSRGIVDGLAAGGMKSNRAMLLVAMHAVAVEERLLGNMS